MTIFSETKTSNGNANDIVQERILSITSFNTHSAHVCEKKSRRRNVRANTLKILYNLQHENVFLKNRIRKRVSSGPC